MVENSVLEASATMQNVLDFSADAVSTVRRSKKGKKIPTLGDSGGESAATTMGGNTYSSNSTTIKPPHKKAGRRN